MVVTAARPDRTSFGCGELDHYTYFDDCFLRAIPHAEDFAALGSRCRPVCAPANRTPAPARHRSRRFLSGPM